MSLDTAMPAASIHPAPRSSISVAPVRETFRLPALICAFGILLLFFLPPSVLDAVGMGFSNEKGNYLEKIHPGTAVVLFSFAALLVNSGSPIGMLFRIWRERFAYALMLSVVVMLIFYTTLRSGPSGVSFLVYTHLDVPIVAIVFSYAPWKFCRRFMLLFVSITVLNAVVGILEGIGHFRIMPYDPDWQVARDPDFRSSAFLGHPLNNALFTASMMPIVAVLPLRPFLKAMAVIILMVALVPFGGRAAFIIGTFSIIPVCFFLLYRARKSLTFLRMLMLGGAVIIAPIAAGLGLFGLINSPLGERLAAHNTIEDESAQNRYYSFNILDRIEPQELVFGISADRESELITQLGIDFPVSDIENPWLIMLIYLGAIMFVLWLAVTAIFILRAVRGQPFAIKIAVINYFAIASLADTFGRMDAVYAFVISLIVISGRVTGIDNKGAALALSGPRNYATWPGTNPALRQGGAAANTGA